MPYVWIIVDECADVTYPVKFMIVGTGNVVSSDVMVWHYAGTFQMYGGKLVWHLFYNTKISV